MKPLSATGMIDDAKRQASDLSARNGARVRHGRTLSRTSSKLRKFASDVRASGAKTVDEYLSLTKAKLEQLCKSTASAEEAPHTEYQKRTLENFIWRAESYVNKRNEPPRTLEEAVRRMAEPS